jgi:hypothetical protein
MRARLVVSIVFGLAAVGCSELLRSTRLEPESIRRMHRSVAQIVFVERQILLVNELRELYVSSDGGKHWTQREKGVPILVPTGSAELWAFHGWPGGHGPAGSVLWRSTDAGTTWVQRKYDVPAFAPGNLLPLTALREQGGGLLFLMHDLQLRRPVLDSHPRDWPQVGRPVPTSYPMGLLRQGAAVQHAGAIYVAIPDQISMSTDRAQTWQALSVPSFFHAHLGCAGQRCYALLPELGSRSNALLATSADANEWQTFGDLSLPAVQARLKGRLAGRTVKTFGATALLASDDRVHVTAIVNAGDREPIGVVLAFGPDGSPTGEFDPVPEGLWVIERAPDGTIWLGGMGAFAVRDEHPVPVWSAD